MAKRKSPALTPEEKRHRVAVALPSRLQDYDATPEDARWRPLEDLWPWQGTVDDVQQWMEHAATEAQALYEQLLSLMQQASPSALSPQLRSVLHLQVTHLMAKDRMLAAVYLQSLRPPTIRGKKTVESASRGGIEKARKARATFTERNDEIRQKAVALREKHLPQQDIKSILARQYGLSPRQIGRIAPQS